MIDKNAVFYDDKIDRFFCTKIDGKDTMVVSIGKLLNLEESSKLRANPLKTLHEIKELEAIEARSAKPSVPSIPKAKPKPPKKRKKKSGKNKFLKHFI